MGEIVYIAGSVCMAAWLWWDGRRDMEFAKRPGDEAGMAICGIMFVLGWPVLIPAMIAVSFCEWAWGRITGK